MAINPMQRKARTSFLLGMVITLIITGAIIALLGMKVLSMIQASNKEKEEMTEVYVLTKDVKSGQTIVFDPKNKDKDNMIQIKTVNKNLVPKNAVNIAEHVKSWTLQDKEGNKVYIGVPNKNTNNQNNNNNNNGNTTSQNNNNNNQNSNTTNQNNNNNNGNTTNQNTTANQANTTNEEQQKKESTDYALYINIAGEEYEVKTEEGSGETYYYIEEKINQENNQGNNQETQKKYLELTSTPMVAKIDMKANTVLTPDLITRGDSTVQDDVRRQEYNIAVLPTDLATGDIVDIRVRFPSGQDYIVVSKKTVEIPVIDGLDSVDTFRVNLSEDEILSMSSAIIEAAQISGSEIYLNRYTDPGLQEAAEQNYIPKTEVLNELRVDGTALDRAKSVILGRYFSLDNGQISNKLNDESETLRRDIESQISKQADSQSNIETSVQESITNAKEARTKYVESLSAPVEE